MTSQQVYALLGLTALVAVFVGVVVFAALRFFSAARDTRRHLRETGAETALLSAALQDAVKKLRMQEQAMSARAEASERLSGEIVASLTAGLLVVNDAGEVQILNPAGRRLLGLPAGGATGHYRQLMAGAPLLADAIEESVATGRAIVRRALRMPDGSQTTHLGVTVSPLAGDRQGVICLFSDLTAVIDLEEQLRMKEALARLGELTAGIAHEFRNGLATIHGYSRLIDPQLLPEPYRPYVAGIRDEAEALGRVVTNFLNFAKPDQVVFARVDLGMLARRTIDEARHELPPGSDVSVRGEFGTIEGDDVLLRQMFNNLLRNAVEACEGAGIVPVVTVDGHVDDGEHVTRLTVQDNGPGIDPAVGDKIFRPFFTTRKQGTGLGLAIVQKVVVTHNGRIAVGPSPLGGAAFHLSFPLADS